MATHGYLGNTYIHNNNITQALDGTLTGTGGWDGTQNGILVSTPNTWTLDTGSLVSGDSIHLNYHYTSVEICAENGSVDAIIASDGSMSGTWSDDCSGGRTGSWTVSAGTAKVIPVTYGYKFITTDRGMNGLWATDYFDSKVTITPIGGGCYDVKRVDGGTFQVIDGSFSPGGDGVTKVGDGTKGDVSGGIDLTICGTRIANPDLSTEDLRGKTWSSYADKYFHRFFTDITSEPQGNWGWTFSTCFNGTWVDNDATETAYGSSGPNALMGDIKGTYIPCSKEQCMNDGWRSFTNPTFKNQGACVSYSEKLNLVGKATGGIQMSSPSQQMNLSVFDFGSSSPWDKGTVEYWNYEYPGILHYTANILCATVDTTNNNARFMFQIPAGWPGLTGLYVVAAVHDGGTPGTNGDTYGHTSTWDLGTAKSWCESGTGVAGYPIVGGNLVVHK